MKRLLVALLCPACVISGVDVTERRQDRGRPDPLDDTDSDGGGGGAVCGLVTTLSPPVPAARYVTGSYQHREFLDPINHLGEDIALPEGTPVHTLGPGRIVYSGPAIGYGELLVVVEYAFAEPTLAWNGDNEVITFTTAISISGHLRRSEHRGGAELPLRVGDCVGSDTVIGYVNDDAHNGDGAEHLHQGLRLMSAADAWARDGRYAYRGYDDNGRFRGDFAALSTLLSHREHGDEDAPPDEHPDTPDAAAPLGDGCVAAPEICNGRDDDCDGAVDEDLPILRCGESACERLVRSCEFGMPVVCVPGTPEPEVCGDNVDNDCNGRIDDCPPPDPPPADDPACGASVEVRWNHGTDWVTVTSDLYPDWHWGEITGGPRFTNEYPCVPSGLHRLNGRFPGRHWGCEEWPEGHLTVPYGLPQVLIDGHEVSVHPVEEPGLDLGCNLQFSVP